MSSRVVRPATAADYSAVAALWRQQNAFHAALEPGRMQLVDECLPRAEFQAHLHSREREVAVAEGAGTIQGFALLVERHHQGGWAVPVSVAFVQEICVAESARRSGVGRSLMAYVEAWGRRRGLGSIELNVWARNEDALAFYEELGFRALRHELCKPVKGT